MTKNKSDSEAHVPRKRKAVSPVDPELALLMTEDDAAVVDEAATEPTHSEIFSITSYGADYTVDGLVKRMNSKTFYVPPFQRSYVWSHRQASRFVESLLMGLPVPGLFVFKESDSPKHLIIDGQQRLKTLQFFYDGLLRGKEFTLIDVNDRWEGKTYKSLSEEDRQGLDDQIIHTTIFKQDKPEDGRRSIYEIFERINTGGVKLSAQEIRSCVEHGDFIELLRTLNKNQKWREIYGAESDRLKDQELILRFFALHDGLNHYRRPLRIFLDDYLHSKATLSKDEAARLTRLFDSTISFVHGALGARAFRPGSQLNTAVFDSVMVALAARLARSPEPNASRAKAAYDALLAKAAYQEAYTKSTADEDQVQTRIRLATESFQEA